MTSCMCASCKTLWNKDPLVVNKRKYCNESSFDCTFDSGACLDCNGKKIMCRKCFRIVRSRHESAQKSSAGFYSRQSSSNDAACAKLAKISPDAFNAMRDAHEEETHRRLRWCLDNNMTPAHDYVHLAPGDDAQFMV